MVGRLENYVAATTAVAAVRSAELNKGLAPERHRAVAALARPDKNLNLIYERLRLHGRYFTIFGEKPRRRQVSPLLEAEDA